MFAETFTNHTPGGPFIIVSSVDSTNNYAMAKLHAGLVQAGSCFQAVEQHSGKGQRGRQWLARKGASITMSVCLRPVHREFPFLTSAAIALGCYDFIKEFDTGKLAIKWPNDVYINDRKAAGILIETIFKGASWEWAVAGIGVNVNQSDFGPLQDKATSLKLEAGTDFDVTAKARDLHRAVLKRQDWMSHVSADEIMQQYNQVLYRKMEEVKIKKDNAVFKTVIKEVSVTGDLLTEDSMERSFRVGEIEFL